jgi:cysteine desulfurase
VSRVRALRDRLLAGLLERVPDCRLTGSRGARLPHHVSLVLRGVKADSVLLDLDLAGVAASTGSACASLTQTASHVLRAIGCTPEEAEGSLCFTLGRWSTAADVESVLDRLPPIVSRLRALAPVAPR